ncbi:carboxymuconolactone decarboxylase family protein [Crossiella sp. SN42]|uniref:carboxymuconolactone decarboxylase family protein n=1 Tax=Crossiella sp. SN42 TaxID=2944808 RepID=UPI00207D08D2|nr:carboxymuconolactone decarboxylase family protein [Crossiella sp. SN42]MCO1577347.1 carboxymuconolactone decarboxylase family protein [Crossiella sp. SN42]
MATTAPRIPPLEPPYQPHIQAMLDKWMPPDSAIEPLALFRTFGVHDELFSRMLPLGAGILGHGRVEPRLREVVIHRTCALCGAEYEWGVHAVVFGKPLGLTDAQLFSTVHGNAEDPVWSPPEALVFRLADALHTTGGLSDELFAELAAHFPPDEILELVITAGWYRTISTVINVAGVELEQWAARFPEADQRQVLV